MTAIAAELPLGQLEMIHGVLNARVLVPVAINDERQMLDVIREMGGNGWTPGDVPLGGYSRPYAEADTFDFRFIGAEYFELEDGKKKCLKHRGLVYTRREEAAVEKASKKMPAKIWYSRGAKATDGDTKDDNGTIQYVTLISFVGNGRADARFQKRADRATPPAQRPAPQPQQQQQAAPEPRTISDAEKERYSALLKAIYAREDLSAHQGMPPKDHPFHVGVRRSVAYALKIERPINSWFDFSFGELERYINALVDEETEKIQPAPAPAARPGGLSELARSNILIRFADLQLVTEVAQRDVISAAVGSPMSLDELNGSQAVQLLNYLVKKGDT